MEALSGTVEDLGWIAVEEASAAGRVRREATTYAQNVGFSQHRVGEVAIVAAELASNLHRHAVAGAVLLRLRREASAAAIELVCVDAGPGVNLVDAAQDGRSTRGTLGIGLGAAMRLSTFFDAHSVPGVGTVMVATLWDGDAPVARPRVAGITRPMGDEPVCGDVCAARVERDATTLMLADGLGHGELAAMAAREAARSFLAAPSGEPPARTLERLNGALRPTRGAAVAVVRIDAAGTELTMAGVGNVAVWIDDGERRSGLLSTPGIVGAATRTAREVTVPIPPHALVAMHSDGLTSKWSLDRYPGLRVRDPLLVAAVLLRDAGLRRDDASVLIARAS
ncbi:MAG TPA: SpoIIE family protein phosphatase [Candidatus Elarobacter sp.]